MSNQTLALVPTSTESSTEIDPVPADVQAVIDLFTTHLAKVQFPDVDAATLRKHADELRAEARSVARARDALAAAIAASEARLATLTGACTRAVAYAKIFSDAQPERQQIADALAALARPAVSAEPAVVKRPRGRPPGKAKPVELAAAPTLVFSEPHADAEPTPVR